MSTLGTDGSTRRFRLLQSGKIIIEKTVDKAISSACGLEKKRIDSFIEEVSDLPGKAFALPEPDSQEKVLNNRSQAENNRSRQDSRQDSREHQRGLSHQ